MTNTTAAPRRVQGDKTLGNNLASNLAEIRNARGFTWSWLSERLERAGQPIPVLGLRRIVAGQRRVDLDEARAIAEVLDTTVDALASTSRPEATREHVEQKRPNHRYPVGYLGPAAMLRLDVACAAIYDAFGAPPYLVGSVLERPDYRDVDVRLIIDDQRYEQMFPNASGDPSMRHLALLINSALSDWLTHATGLPVDFQIQSQTQANEYSGRQRNPLAFHDVAIRQGERDRR